MARPEVIALFGPTGVGKTAVAIALARRLRALGEHPVAVSADALQVYAGLETLTGARHGRERALLEHRLISLLPVDATFSAGQYAELAHAEIDGLLADGPAPDRGRRHRALPAGGADRAEPAARRRRRACASAGPPSSSVAGRVALHATLARRAPWAAAEIEPTDRQRIVRSLELLDMRRARAAPGGVRAVDRRVRRPTLLVGLVMEREALYARIDARVEEMVAAGAEDEVRRANAAGASATARKALGFRGAARPVTWRR